MLFSYDPTFILLLPAILLALYAQFKVQSTYAKLSEVHSKNGLTGAAAGRKLLDASGLSNVRIEQIPGNLTDNYDPRSKVLHLSRGVYENSSVASMAIAAHELGHAVQDQEAYFPLRFRAALVPAVNIGSYLGWILIIIGMLLNYTQLAWVGLAVFSFGAIFALATLPVELNASARAKRLLVDSGLVVSEDEQRGVNSVLNAAALTYVAALFTAVMQLLYFATMVLGMGGRRRS